MRTVGGYLLNSNISYLSITQWNMTHPKCCKEV